MRWFRIVAPAALGAGLIAFSVAPGGSAGTASSVQDVPVVADSPVAHAAGGAVAPATLPSLVNDKVARTEAALARAAALVDQNKYPDAIRELNTAVLNMRRAWTRARYIIMTAPPPPPAEAGGMVVAHASGDAPAAGAVASPEETAFAVLTLQHTVITTSIGLIDGADATLAQNIDAAISTAIAARDRAIAYIHSIAPPPPPAEAGGMVVAYASGAAVVGSTWDSVMPGLIPLLDDEIQEAEGQRALIPTSRVDLGKVVSGANATKTRVNTYWPPLPAGD